jgi:hypothetical protein
VPPLVWVRPQPGTAQKNSPTMRAVTGRPAATNAANSASAAGSGIESAVLILAWAAFTTFWVFLVFL